MTPRFQRVAWLRKGWPSKVHLEHEGKVLCGAGGAADVRIPVSGGRDDCFTCVKRGRFLQGRNVYTGIPK